MLYPATRDGLMEFKEKILRVRECLFISQKELAKKLDISFATVNRLEKGHTKPSLITSAKFQKFCKDNNIVF